MELISIYAFAKTLVNFFGEKKWPPVENMQCLSLINFARYFIDA
jgi:hypothetical protein